MADPDRSNDWDDAEGEHWVRWADAYDAMLDPFGGDALAAAAIGRADRVLDIGCGCGSTTLDAALHAPDGSVLGLDLSGPMLAEARARAARRGIANVELVQADAQVHSLPKGSFDVAISRFGVMFFADPVAAFANIGGALRSGGRLAFVCWQAPLANEWIVVPGAAVAPHVGLPEGGEPDAPGPFAFADPDRVRGILAGAGFAQTDVRPVEQRLWLPGPTVDETIAFLLDTGIGRSLFAEASPAARDAALGALTEALRAHAEPDGIHLGGAAWLVTAVRP